MALGIAIIVGAVIAWYLFSRLLNRASAVATGAITGNTRTRGLNAVHLGQRFTVPVDGRQVIERVIETLELGEKRKDGLVIGSLDSGRENLVIDILGHTRFVIATEPAASGASGQATVAAWREVEGRIPATEPIERIHKHLQAAVFHLGGSSNEY